MPRDLTPDELAQLVPDPTDDAAQAVGDASIINPDQRADRERRASILGVEPAATEDGSFDASLARAEAARKARENLTDAPNAARWVSQPENAAVAHDDTGPLAAWDRYRDKHRLAFKFLDAFSFWGFVDSNEGRGITERSTQVAGGLARTAVTTVDPLADRLTALTEQAGVPAMVTWDDQGIRFSHATPEDIASPVGGQGNSSLLRAAANVDFNYTPPATWEDVKREPVQNILPYIYGTAITSTPDMVAAIYNLPLYIMARTGEIGQQRAENNDPQGLLDQIDPEGKVRRLPPDANLNDLLTALPFATASALLERWGAEGVFGLNEVTAKAAIAALKETGKAALREGGTEGVQQVLEDTGAGIGTRAGLDPRQMADNAMAASVGGAGFGGVAHGPVAVGQVVDARVQRQRAIQVQATQTALDDIAANAAESKLNGRDPARYAGAVDQITAGQPHGQMFVDAEALVQLFQTRGVDPRSAAQELGISPGDLATAQATGGAVTISTGTWAAKIANTDMEAGLRPHVSFDPAIPTQAQQEAAEAAQPDLEAAQQANDEVAAAQGEADAAATQALTERYTAELTATGQFTDSQVAKIVAFRVHADQAQASRLGLSTEEFHRQFPPERVVAAQQPPARPARVTRTPAAPGAVRSALAAASQATGADQNYLARLTQKESTFDPNAANPASTAVGLQQFIDGTWVDQMRKHGTPEQQAVARTIRIAKGGRAVITDEAQRQLMALRTDAATSSLMAGHLTAENARALKAKLGRDPTDGELYLAHFMGSGRAIQFLQADPNGDAAALFPREAAANRSIYFDKDGRHRTVAEVKARLTHGFDGGAVSVPEGGEATAADGESVTPDAPVMPEAVDTAALLTADADQNMGLPEAPAAPDAGAQFDALVSETKGATQGQALAALMARQPVTTGPDLTEMVTALVGGEKQATDADLRGPSLLKLVADSGGIIDQGGEMSGVDAQTWHKGKAFQKKLVREPNPEAGQDAQYGMDAWVQRAVERGYLPEGSTQVEFMEAVRRELAGQPTYAQDAAPEALARREAMSSLQDEIDREGIDTAQPVEAIVKQVKQAREDRELAQALEDFEAGRELDQRAARVLYQSQPQLFYSALERFVDEKGQGKATPDQWMNTLRNAAGIKREELEWSGLLDWLEAEKEAMSVQVTKADVQAFLAANGVRIEEVVHADRTDAELQAEAERLSLEYIEENNIADEDAEKFGPLEFWNEARMNLATPVFAGFRLDGGENYREVLLLLPGDERQKLVDDAGQLVPNPRYRQPMTATHWDQPNVIAHTRLTDRTDADGARVLFVEEVQSDWHQKGRERGYNNAATQAERDALAQASYFATRASHAATERLAIASKDLVAQLREKGIEDLEGLGSLRKNGLEYFDRNGFSLQADTAKGLVLALRQYPVEGITVSEELNAAFEEAVDTSLKATEAEMAYNRANNLVGIPDAPFKTAWPALVMKRIIRMAAEQGYDRVAWTTGQQQIDRYNLAAAVGEHVGVRRRVDGNYEVRLSHDAARAIVDNGKGSSRNDYGGGKMGVDMTPDDMREVFGQHMAAALIAAGDRAADTMAAPSQADGVDDLEWIGGGDIAVGGDGMRAFYDRNLVNITNDIVKKYGAKVGQVDLGAFNARDDTAQWREALRGAEANISRIEAEVSRAQERGLRTDALEANLERYQDEAETLRQNLDIKNGQPGFDITDQLREAALGGFAMFQDDLTDGDKRGSVVIPNGGLGEGRQATINLFAASDLSTFLHETGHVFLERLTAMASMPDAPQQIRDDMNAVLEWLNVPDAAHIDVQAHEKWAEGFEQYLYEGRAPSPTLRGAFEAFRSWLVFIYRRLRGVRLDLADDVRNVMDRLIATDEQIAASRAQDGMADDLTGEALGLSPEMAVEYERMRADAIAQAQGEADARVLSAVARQKAGWWKRERERRRDEIDAEVASRPVYRAFEWLAHGKWLNGDAPEGLGEVKLDRASLVNAYSADILKKLPKGFGRVYADDGTHPDVVADVFGFDSGDELVQALTGMEKRAAVVDRETDAAMLEAHPDPIDQVEEIATKANHNVSQQRVLEIQYQAMSGRTVHKGIAEAARRAMASRTVKELLNPDKHLMAERRAANAAIAAFKKGDLAEGAKQKYRQLVAFHTWRAAREAADQIEKGERLFANVIGGKQDNVARARNMDLVQAARAILGAYGIGSSRDNPLAYMGLIREYDPDLADALEPQIADASQGAQGSTDALTYDEYIGLRETVASLWNQSKRTKKVEIEGRLVELEQIAGQLGDVIFARTKQGDMEETKAQTDTEKVLRGISGVRASIRRVEHWAHLMDGGVPGPFTKFVWRLISQGADAHRAYSAGKRRVLADLFKTIQPHLTWKKIAAPELGHTFANKLELLHAILHTGNESNKRKLLLGGRGGQPWAVVAESGEIDTSRWDRFLARAIKEGAVTQEDYVFAQGVWDLLDSMKPEAQRAHRQMFGRYFDEVTANPVKTPWGEFRGGYVPAQVDTALVQDGALRAEAEKVNDGNSFMFPSAARGFTKARSETYAKPLALDLRLLAQHIDKVSMFSHLASPVRDVMRVLNHKMVKEGLQQLDPVAMSDMLLPWLNRSVRQITSVPMGGKGGWLLDKFFGGVRARASLQIMVGNIVNALQQVTGFSITMVKVKPSHMAKALWMAARDPMGVAQTISAASPMMADRLASQGVEAAHAVSEVIAGRNPYERTKQLAQKHGYFLQHGFQNLVDTISWLGANSQALAEGADMQEAVRQADAIVRMTQGSLHPEDIARFEAGNSAMRLFTTFASYFNMQGNLLATELQLAGERKDMMRAAWVIVAGFSIPALLADAISRALRGGFDDDEDDGYLDEVLDWFFGSQLRGGLALVPLAGPATVAGFNAFNDKPYDDKLSLSPGVSAAEVAVRVPGEIYKLLVEGEGDASRTTKDFLTTLGLVTGIPFGALGRPLGYAADVAEGDVEPTGPLDAARGAISGQPSPASKVP